MFLDFVFFGPGRVANLEPRLKQKKQSTWRTRSRPSRREEARRERSEHNWNSLHLALLLQEGATFSEKKPTSTSEKTEECVLYVLTASGVAWRRNKENRGCVFVLLFCTPKLQTDFSAALRVLFLVAPQFCLWWGAGEKEAFLGRCLQATEGRSVIPGNEAATKK